MGVTVTFVAILELVREGLIDIVQTEAYAPLHVRRAEGQRGLKLAVDNDAQFGAAANEAVMEGAEEQAMEPAAAFEDDADDAEEQGDLHE
jgi:segregation and condensation protein A